VDDQEKALEAVMGKPEEPVKESIFDFELVEMRRREEAKVVDVDEDEGCAVSQGKQRREREGKREQVDLFLLVTVK
jgi:hypothetical protein